MASNKLQKKDYTRASLRAYFLQNGMNYSNYQGLGYANMLYPGLRKIYDDDDQLRDALKEMWNSSIQTQVWYHSSETFILRCLMAEPMQKK